MVEWEREERDEKGGGGGRGGGRGRGGGGGKGRRGEGGEGGLFRHTPPPPPPPPPQCTSIEPVPVRLKKTSSLHVPSYPFSPTSLDCGGGNVPARCRVTRCPWEVPEDLA